ncbi:MAG: sulfurtransferase-like selenium metabolism protein YedF [Peptococcaceae bacterium]|nr:sulfurtransferase-like selenium metabolism protein YedF [Peptococcaceae bacterium]
MSESINVDCRGLACPQPVIKTKKALDSIDQGTVVVLVDNDTARENVTLFAGNAGFKAEVDKTGEGYRITITKGGPAVAGRVQAASPPAEGLSSTVYLITTNMLGQGSPDLGQVLIKSLMVTLSEMDRPPRALLFLNSGVFLTCQGSPVLEQLQTLSSRGTALISCGTCLEYYRLKDKLNAGRIGNMMEINGHLSESAKVITIP